MADEEKLWVSLTGDWLTGWDDARPTTSSHTALFDEVQTDAKSNLDRSADAVKRVVTTPRYGGDIGGPSNPLIIGLNSTGDSAARVVHRGSGVFWFKANTGDFTDVYVDSPNPNVAMFVDGTSIRHLIVRAGKVIVLPTCNGTGKLMSVGPTAHIVVQEAASSETKFANVIATSGLIEIFELPTGTAQFLALGGTIRCHKAMGSSFLVVTSAGEFDYRPDTDPSGSPDFVNLGSIDLRQSRYNVTFDELFVGPGAMLFGEASPGSGGPFPGDIHINMNEEFP